MQLGYTPLLIATMNNYEDCLEVLLARGASVDYQCEVILNKLKPVTCPLQGYCQLSDWQCMQGVKPAVLFAAVRGYDNCFRMLLQHGANLGQVIQFGILVQFKSCYRNLSDAAICTFRLSQYLAQIVVTVLGVGHADSLTALLDHGVAADEVGPVSSE